jgi:hypothetical protein
MVVYGELHPLPWAYAYLAAVPIGSNPRHFLPKVSTQSVSDQPVIPHTKRRGFGAILFIPYQNQGDLLEEKKQ